MTSEARTTTAEGRSVSQMLWIGEDTLKRERPSDERSEDYDGEAGVCLRWHRGSGNLLQPVTGDGRSPSPYILILLICLSVCPSVRVSVVKLLLG